MLGFDVAAIERLLAGRARIIGTFAGKACAPAPPGPDEIRMALERPAWGGTGRCGSVFDAIRPGESVAIAVSDHTRKTAVDRLLPVLVEGWLARGCRLEDMFLIFASGIHRPPTAGEQKDILGAAEAMFRGRVFLHEPDNDRRLVRVGVTRRGHEVRINRRAVEADRLILTGAAAYHYHAGFGGGRKSLVPGLAARSTIAFTHSLTLDPDADRIRPGVEPGRLDGNPVAEEMLESARFREPDAIVNTVLTPGGRLAGVFAGGMDAAHRCACALVERVSRIDIDEPADLVVASAASSLNWIQSHKALYNAHRALRSERGRIALFAPCVEGLGDERFRHWVTRPDVREIYAGLRAQPEVLGQTALSTRLRGRQAVLATQMSGRDASDLGIPAEARLEDAIDRCLEDLARLGVKRPTCYLMGDALSLVPFLDTQRRLRPVALH